MSECRRVRGGREGQVAEPWGLSWEAQSSVPLSPKARGLLKPASSIWEPTFQNQGSVPFPLSLVCPVWVQRGLPDHLYLGSASPSPREPSLDGGDAGRS